MKRDELAVRRSPPPSVPRQITCVSDYEQWARERVDPGAWAYLNGAVADGLTLRENLAGFARLKLRGRVLADLANGHARSRLLGDALPAPILLAPVAHQKLAHPDGEMATLLGASAMQAPMVVSTESNTTIEDLAAAARAPLWFQLYLQPRREDTMTLVRRAEDAGYRALVVTVDAPVNGLRNEERRTGFSLPPDITAINLHDLPARPEVHVVPGGSLFASELLAMAPGWKDIAWLCAQTRLPIVLKGVTHPADALRAVDTGVSAIIVSNHGGRVLDSQAATIDVLPGIASAVSGRVPLLLDGGIRRGSDVFKALALGASAVLVGRPIVHALAVAGASGVAHMLHLLRVELEMTMALCGCGTLAEINPACIVRSDGGWI